MCAHSTSSGRRGGDRRILGLLSKQWSIIGSPLQAREMLSQEEKNFDIKETISKVITRFCGVFKGTNHHCLNSRDFFYYMKFYHGGGVVWVGFFVCSFAVCLSKQQLSKITKKQNESSG